MQNEKMREQFNTWSAEQIQRLLAHGEPTAAKVWRDFESLAWAAWQASRESLVIDLDAAARTLAESVDYPWEFMPEQGRTRMKANARMVIEAAGLKVKP